MKRPATRNRVRLEAALAGVEPAEALTTRDRHRLVGMLVRDGWTDVDIAALTRMTTYTTARIRTRLDLPANPPILEELAA
ncbi:MAG TPA: hypothetical protein VIP28_15445 [Nocardioides sp.]